MRLLLAFFILRTFVTTVEGNLPKIDETIDTMTGMSQEDLKSFPDLHYPGCTYDVSQVLYLRNAQKPAYQSASTFYGAFRYLTPKARQFIAKLFHDGALVAQGKITNNVAAQRAQDNIRALYPRDCIDIALVFPQIKQLGELLSPETFNLVCFEFNT
ncbi:hypothetical protein KIN20_000557 [Parelaphostrongylus tenuis]|uniref:Uncharacterized protein n=1 Tax=Parelaphostrongylus tenuis TaxID=148309 RepID=A0AAD5MBJ8_PARTN|nr:hypothetical protein KIN20_000557 [Parelaphostrongylus tenuis]